MHHEICSPEHYTKKYKYTKKVNKIGEIPNIVYSSLINLKPK